MDYMVYPHGHPWHGIIYKSRPKPLYRLVYLRPEFKTVNDHRFPYLDSYPITTHHLYHRIALLDHLGTYQLSTNLNHTNNDRKYDSKVQQTLM